MPIRHSIWKVGSKPERLPEASLPAESTLEDMIVEDPDILSEDWLLIGRQVPTAYGKLIDLLAIGRDGQLIIVELKRHKTPRDVVAQAIDYASWIQDLESEKIAEIHTAFRPGISLNDAFQQRFGTALDEDQLNAGHQIVIVASSLDPSTERIVNYLNAKDIAINVMFFQVFSEGTGQLLSRAWLIDPLETDIKASSGAHGTKVDWNGEYYASFGHSPQGRNWEDAERYGFISAGGGLWYSQTLRLLSPGDRVWVNVPKHGYVGVGIVKSTAVRASEFFVEVDGQNRRFLDIANWNNLRKYTDDEEKSEYFVPMDWIETRSLKDAVWEVGFFALQHSVCRPRTLKWNQTVDALKTRFTKVS